LSSYNNREWYKSVGRGMHRSMVQENKTLNMQHKFQILKSYIVQ
jgi:hypothetical protein